MGDVRVTAQVFDAQMKKYDDLPKDVSKLNSFSTRKDNRFVTSDRKFYWRNGEAALAFGKFKSKSLQWLKENQPAYLREGRLYL